MHRPGRQLIRQAIEDFKAVPISLLPCPMALLQRLQDNQELSDVDRTAIAFTISQTLVPFNKLVGDEFTVAMLDHTEDPEDSDVKS